MARLMRAKGTKNWVTDQIEIPNRIEHLVSDELISKAQPFTIKYPIFIQHYSVV